MPTLCCAVRTLYCPVQALCCIVLCERCTVLYQRSSVLCERSTVLYERSTVLHESSTILHERCTAQDVTVYYTSGTALRFAMQIRAAADWGANVDVKSGGSKVKCNPGGVLVKLKG